MPSYCGVRTETQKYVRYVTGERELYDLSEDPDEMVNVVDDPARADDVATARRPARRALRPAPARHGRSGVRTPAAVALVGVAGRQRAAPPTCPGGAGRGSAIE